MEDCKDFHWYIGHTRTFHEKKVAARLADMGVDVFVATQKEKRKWSDRIKYVDKVVLNGYVFIHTTEEERLEILKNHVGLIGFMSRKGTYRPIIVPDKQMERFRTFLTQHDEMVEFMMEDFTPGDKVVITQGPLTGIEGEIIKIENKNKFCVRLDGFGTASINIESNNIYKKLES